MKEFFSKKGIYIVLAAVIIAIITALSAAASGGNAGFADMLSEPFFKPLKSVMTSIVNTLEDVYGYMYKYDNIVMENEKLRARVSELEEEYREYTEISEENERLRALLDFDARHKSDSFTYLPASVISWTASNFSSSFTISQGSSSGVELGDSVITDTGYLVGKVTEVGASSATVTTIIDTSLSIGALTYSTNATGIVSGDFDLFNDGLLYLGYLNEDANIIIGDTVTTSGKGGTFPSGIVIGYIESIAQDTSGLNGSIIVKPAADVTEVTHIFVITDFIVND